MKRPLLAVALVTALLTASAQTAERGSPHGTFGRLDHVFLVIMENRTNTDILDNPNAPFINAYARLANQATDYFAVGHPSAPNYLELVGGSNFGLTNDYWPNWVTTGCIDNAPRSTGCANAFTPIAVAALDNSVVATASKPSDCNGELRVNGTPVRNNCARQDRPAIRLPAK